MRSNFLPHRRKRMSAVLIVKNKYVCHKAGEGNVSNPKNQYKTNKKNFNPQ